MFPWTKKNTNTTKKNTNTTTRKNTPRQPNQKKHHHQKKITTKPPLPRYLEHSRDSRDPSRLRRLGAQAAMANASKAARQMQRRPQLPLPSHEAPTAAGAIEKCVCVFFQSFFGGVGVFCLFFWRKVMGSFAQGDLCWGAAIAALTAYGRDARGAPATGRRTWSLFRFV